MSHRSAAIHAVVVSLALAVAANVCFAQQGRISIYRIGGYYRGDSVLAGENLRFVLRYTNNTGQRTDIWNGFRISSPDGAIWDSTTADTLGGIWSSRFNIAAGIFRQSTDGVGSDTIGFYGAGISGNSNQQLPISWDDSTVAITVHFSSRVSRNRHICIDSAFFGTGGTWKWPTYSGGLIEFFPVFDGLYSGQAYTPGSGYCFFLFDACVGGTDSDNDGVADLCDNCPTLANSSQQDSDLDGKGDVCDNCPTSANPNQSNTDGDAFGDICDPCPTDSLNDVDHDGLCANLDNCPAIANAAQEDADHDGIGDSCDVCTDTDHDGRGNPGFPRNSCAPDNCPSIANANQQDTDNDGIGDECDLCTDTDNDGFGDPGFFRNTCPEDNCPTTYNPSQADADHDGKGDACDAGMVDFSTSVRCGGAPLSVSFTDISVPVRPITSWEWDFGDGHTSTSQNPTHDFDQVGAFAISLIISDGSIADTVIRPGYITTQAGITADFIGLPTSGRSALTVMFEPVLLGVANEYRWYFGDGDSSSLPNPIHTYAAQGRYDVTLVSRLIQDDCNQADTVTKPDYIVVQDLQPSFTANPTAGTEPLLVQFTDSSVGNPLSWYWNFGDGSTSTQQNPSHIYNTEGIYDVLLRVENNVGIDSMLWLSCIRVDSHFVDLETQVARRGWVQFRPGFPFSLVFFWANLGATPADNCTLKILLPPELIFGSIDWINTMTGTYSGYSFSGDTILIPLQTIGPWGWPGGWLQVNGTIPETTPIGDTLICKNWLTTTSPESHTSNNSVIQNLIVVGSWDPNDKIADPGGKEVAFDVEPDQRIEYTVQFENKKEATAEAIYVRVVDTLDDNLDWGTLAFGPMSHPENCNASFDPYTGVITWFCDSILLPPNVNPPEGEGYFTYSVKPKPDLPDGTAIPNRAHIRFDYNPWLAAPEDGPIIRLIRQGCCTGTTGNVNGSGIVDLADLSAIVSYLTGGGYVLPCPPEANVNAYGIVDLADLSSLVSYLTGGGYVLPACPVN